MSNHSINKVAIVGGTHGNELTGVYLVKKFEDFSHLIARSNFKTMTLLAHPKAIEAGVRYIDSDLNRCFNPQDLQNKNLFNYEQLRAKQIAQCLQQEKVDFIIDLHSSTADMGLTIILNNNNPFLLKLVTYLTSVNPAIRVLQYSANSWQSPYLRNLCQLGLAIEVGPVPHGVLDITLFEQTENLIKEILDYIELYNLQKAPHISNFCTLYKQIGVVDYPRDNDRQITAMIAPQLRDYQPLNPNSPMFFNFQGQVLPYQGNSTVYPVFIGEAAYVEKGIAMCLTSKEVVRVPEST